MGKVLLLAGVLVLMGCGLRSPGFAKYTAAEVVAHLRSQGLDVLDPAPASPRDLSVRGMPATSCVPSRLVRKSMAQTTTAWLWICPDEAGQRVVTDYMKTWEYAGLGYQNDFAVRGNAILTFHYQPDDKGRLNHERYITYFATMP